MSGVSIYFPAGDFTEVMQRYDRGRDQVYQAHNEAARLFHDLLEAGQQLNVYSFFTTERRDECPIEGLRVVSLGAKDFTTTTPLKAAIADDNADAIVVHFASLELLRAAPSRKKRVCAVLADSFNRAGVRSTFAKWRIVSLLNNPRIELVANHCLPATEHLAQIGVRRDKLIPWDVSHPFEPAAYKPKELTTRHCFEAVYAGSVVEGKGITDLIRAIALLRDQGLEVHCTLAGLGDINTMESLGAGLNVSDLFSFVGLKGNTEVFKMMEAADLVVVPSRTTQPEGFPFTMFEAIASRTPIVCSNHPMFRNVMIDGRSASVFPSGDYRGLAAAMLRTLTDPILYAKLSTNAPLTWAALKGPADWRTLIFKWVVEGLSSPWIQKHMLITGRSSGRE